MNQQKIRWVVLFLAMVSLVFSVSACGSDTESFTLNFSSSSKPSYCGTWNPAPDPIIEKGLRVDPDNWGQFIITEEAVQYTRDDLTFPISAVSKDEYYTYLEITYQGEIAYVLVILNKDMIAVCDTAYANSKYVGVTPNGTKFDAEIRGNVLYKAGAFTTDIPESVLKGKDIPDGNVLYYYESADVLVLYNMENMYHKGTFAVTSAYEIEYAEGITLVNMTASGNTWIPANGNFVITDNK